MGAYALHRSVASHHVHKSTTSVGLVATVMNQEVHMMPTHDRHKGAVILTCHFMFHWDYRNRRYSGKHEHHITMIAKMTVSVLQVAAAMNRLVHVVSENNGHKKSRQISHKTFSVHMLQEIYWEKLLLGRSNSLRNHDELHKNST